MDVKVAVVVLNWNGSQLLKRFLPPLIEHSSLATIYVADNASEDDSLAMLQQHFPAVRLIKNSRNGGFAWGYNQALRQVHEEFIVLLNSDVEVTDNWLQPLIKAFEIHPNLGAVQPKILSYNNKDRYEYAGAAGGFLDFLGYPYCRGRIFDTLEEDHGQYDTDIKVFWTSGACMAIRKELFFEAGGFDEDFFAHQEEIDLCWRLQSDGHPMLMVAGSKVYHMGGGTLAHMHPRKTYFNFRNNLFLLLKNLPAVHLLPVLLSRLCLDGVAGIRFLMEGKASHCFAIVQAHFSFYRNFIKMLRKRTNKGVNVKYYDHLSIVFSYFIRGQKTFRSIKK